MKKDPLVFWVYFFINCIVLVLLILLKPLIEPYVTSLAGLVIVSFIVSLFLSALFFTLYQVLMLMILFFILSYLLYRTFDDPALFLDPLLVLGAGFLLFNIFSKLKKAKLSFEIDKSNLKEQINDQTKKNEIDQNTTQSLIHKTKRYKKLRNIAEDLSSTLSLEEIADRILTATTKTIKTGDCWRLFLLDKDMRTFHMYKEKIFTDQGYNIPLEPNDWANKWILNNRKPLIISDLKEDFRFEQKEHAKSIRSLISVPMITDNKILGILRLESSKENIFHIEDLRLLAIIANIAALSIQNIHLYRDTHELSIRDGLTNLYVQKYFREKLKESLTTVEPCHISLIMADIDNFKIINDTYGHTIGDAVIINIGRIIQQKVSSHALVARYGGEEFAILYTNYPRHKVLEEAEDIRAAVEKTDFEIRREDMNITLSLGLAHRETGKISMEELINTADKALYKAKKKGKNCVVVGK